MSFRGHVSEEKVSEVQQKMAQLFGEPKAKDVGDGLVKGVKTIGKGFFAGLGTLVTTPAAGLAQEGGIGLLKGAAAGVVGAGVMVGSGFVMAARQVGSGIANTPEAVKSMLDNDKTEALAGSAELLDDAEVRALNEKTYLASRSTVEAFAFGEPVIAQDTSASGLYGGTPSPQEVGLYELLRVSPVASQTAIRNSYYTLAVGNKPADEDKAAELAEACQVLMDPKARKIYDESGKEALGKLPTLEAPVFNSMLFGTEAFKPLVGEFLVARVAAGDVSVDQARKWQRGREQALADAMLARLEPWVKGRKESFIMDSLATLVELRGEPFAEPIVQCIGYTLYHMAEVSLGLESTLTVPAHLQAGLMLEELLSGDVEPRPIPSEASAPAFLDALWLISALDIESTLRQVVELLVLDKKVAHAERRERAIGILKFGKVFLGM